MAGKEWGRFVSLNPTVRSFTVSLPECTFGKSKHCFAGADWRMATLSRNHCRVFLENNTPYIEDLDSKHGTFINSKQIPPKKKINLTHGDVITFCLAEWSEGTGFRFEDPNRVDTSSPAAKKKQTGTTSRFGKTKLVSNARGTAAVSTGTGGRGSKSSSDLDSPEEFLSQIRFKPGATVLEKLTSTIQTNGEDWLSRFLELGGAAVIVKELEVRLKKSQIRAIDKMIAIEAVKTLQQMMQYQNGFDTIISIPNSIGIISLGLDADSLKLHIFVALFLSAVCCISPKGHQVVIEAFSYFQKEKNERVRFKKLVLSLKTEDDQEYKLNCIRLINSMISRYPSIEQRTSIRQEFKTLGLIDILESIRNFDSNRDLLTEIDGFFEEMAEDQKETIVNNVDLSDPVEICKALVSNTHGKAYQFLTEVMQQLFSIPTDIEGLETWRVAEQVLRSAVVTEPSIASKKLDFGTIRKMKKMSRPGDLINEDYQALRTELHSLKDEIEKMKVKHLEEVNTLVDKFAEEKKELRTTLEAEIATLRDRLENGNQSNNVIANQIPHQVAEVVASPPPPPPPTNVPGAPPPPGPPAPPGAFGFNKPNFSEEYPLKPNVQMKKFYWQNIRNNEMEKSIWNSVNFKTVQFLQPNEMEKLFGARKKKTEVEKAEPDKPENPYENAVDLKRSNNIGIMLKHFKISPVAIKNAILQGDTSILTGEKAVSLLKNAPTPEEVELFSQFNGDPQDLGKVEQFLLQMISIPDITERLELLVFRSNFEDNVEDLKFHLQTMTNGAKQVLNSTQFVRLCEVILAVGNFLNYVPYKPPTSGFKINFLTKVIDTRDTENTTTILHYLAGLIQDQQPELLNVTKELDGVGTASRIQSSLLSAEITNITNHLSQLKRLLKKQDPDVNDSRFRELMLSFSLQVKREMDNVVELQNQLNSLTKQLNSFLLEPESNPLEDTLGIISEFILAFEKCVTDNKQEQANREQQERMAAKRKERQEQELLKKQSKLARPAKKKGLMDGAFETVRGGMTFRTKRGVNPMTSDRASAQSIFSTPSPSANQQSVEQLFSSETQNSDDASFPQIPEPLIPDPVTPDPPTEAVVQPTPIQTVSTPKQVTVGEEVDPEIAEFYAEIHQ